MKKNKGINTLSVLASAILVFTQFVFTSSAYKQNDKSQVEIINESGKNIKKAYLYEQKTNLETILIDSLNVNNEKISLNHVNDLNVYKPYIIRFDNKDVEPLFFLVRNNDNLNIKISKNFNIVYSGTSLSNVLNDYHKLINIERESLVDLVENTSHIDQNDTQKLEDARKKYLKSNDELYEKKLKFISSIKDDDVQSYFVLYYIITDGNLDQNILNNYYNSLSKIAKNTQNGKTVENITKHFNAYKLLEQSTYNEIDYIQNEYSKLSLDDKQSEYGKKIESIIKNLKNKFDIFQYQSIQANGKNFDFKNIKQNLILIDFWASWCHPCRQENKKLKEIYNKYKNSKFSLVSYSFDTDKKKWHDAIAKDEIDWINISNLKSLNNDEVAKQLNIRSLPQNLVIKNGVVIAKNIESKELDTFIKNNLN